MKTLKLFPTVIHKFDNPNPRTEEVIKLIEEQKPVQRSGNWDEMKIKTTDGNIHLNTKFKFLIDWFRECLIEYKKYYELDCDGLDIAVCWANKSSAGQGAAHHIHTHNLSCISAVYYVSNGSPTIFYDPLYAKGLDQNEIIWKQNRETEREIFPEPGSLILFPSWLPHSSKPHFTNTDRYTISFNGLPTGKVNSGIYGFPMAHITLNHYGQNFESTENTSSLSRWKESSN
jgi:hypothetical protein